MTDLPAFTDSAFYYACKPYSVSVKAAFLCFFILPTSYTLFIHTDPCIILLLIPVNRHRRLAPCV